jgi:hypothetical protein
MKARVQIFDVGDVKGLRGSAITGNRTRTSVSGTVRRNQIPRLKVGTRWGYISYIYPRTARATGSGSTSTTCEVVGPRLPRSTTYEYVHYHAHHGDLTTPPPLMDTIRSAPVKPYKPASYAEGPQHVEGLHGSAITGNRTRTSVSGAVRRNQVPRLKVGTRWGCISYIYPRTARVTGSRSTSTTCEVVGPTPAECNVRMCPLSCPPRASHNQIEERVETTAFLDESARSQI